MAESVSVPIFDTQRAVEELVAAGMPPEQAVGVVRLQAQWVDRSFATGEDVERLRTDVNGLRTDMDRLRGDLEAKIESQGAEIAKDMAGQRVALESKIEARSTALEGQIAELRGTLEARILASGITTTRWVTGTQVGTSAIFLAALLAALKL